MKKTLNHHPAIVHVGIQVEDLEKAVSFYKELFALKKIPIIQGSLGPMGFIKFGRSEFVLHHVPGEKLKNRNRLDHFGIEVANLKKIYERAIKMGAILG